MNVPPRGSLARAQMELAVHFRRLGRQLVTVPGVGAAPLGLLAGGVYRTWVWLGACSVAGTVVGLVWLALTGHLR